MEIPYHRRKPKWLKVGAHVRNRNGIRCRVKSAIHHVYEVIVIHTGSETRVHKRHHFWKIKLKKLKRRSGVNHSPEGWLRQELPRTTAPGS
jgi:hypothetical protein